MRRVARILMAVGVVSSLGFGFLVPNMFDMLFLVAGVLIMSLGSVLLVLSSSNRRG